MLICTVHSNVSQLCPTWSCRCAPIFVHVRNRSVPTLPRSATGRLQPARVFISLTIAAAHRETALTPANPFWGSLSPGTHTLQPSGAGKIALAPAGCSLLPSSTHRAAAAPVQHAPALACSTRRRALRHVAFGWTRRARLGSCEGMREKHGHSEKQHVHPAVRAVNWDDAVKSPWINHISPDQRVHRHGVSESHDWSWIIITVTHQSSCYVQTVWK